MFFRNHHRPAGWLKEKRGLKPQLTNSSRWNSQLYCLKTFMDDWKLYLDIVREHRDDGYNDIIKIIDDRSIFSSASDLH